MKTYININPTSEPPTLETLRASRIRAFALMLAISEDAFIQTSLETKLGWSEKDMAEGWSLINRTRHAGTAPAAKGPNPVTGAVTRCEEWQDAYFHVARATLELRHPQQAAFVFRDVIPGKGLEAVLAVSMFLEHLRELETGPARKSTRKVDHAAIASIEERGITKEVRKAILSSIEIAQKGDLPPEAETTHPAHVEDLHRLYAWLGYWSGLIRGVITRRDQLIRLGLAKRRSRKVAVVVPPAPPAPPTSPLLTPTRGSKPTLIRDEEAAPDSRAA